MARDFNGSGDYVAHAAAVVSGPPFTCATRFNIDSYAAFNTLFSIMATASNQGFHMSILTDGRGAFQARDSAGIFRNAFSSNTYTAGTWGSCVGVATSTTSRQVFLNGDIANGGVNNDSCSPAALDITESGRFEPTGTSYLDGRGAEMAVWGAALTDDEVTAYDDGYSPLLIRPQSLVAYWPLIGKTSPEIDVVGGFNFTLNGPPAAAAHPRVFMPRKKKLYVFIAGTSVYPVPVSATAGHTVLVQREAQLDRTVASPRIPQAVRVGIKLLSAIRVGVATIVVQIPTLVAITETIAVTVSATLSLVMVAARTAFSGNAGGLGVYIKRKTRWTRRR